MAGAPGRAPATGRLPCRLFLLADTSTLNFFVKILAAGRGKSPNIAGSCYTYGMTMTRNAKAAHSAELAIARETGHTAAAFAYPPLYFAAKAERGHARFTAAEYRVHKMLRGEMNTHRLDIRIEARRAAKCRHRRTRPARPYTGKRRAA